MPDGASRDVPGFWKRSSVRRIVIGFVVLQTVIALGVVGYVLLGWSPFDALFMVVIGLALGLM